MLATREILCCVALGFSSILASAAGIGGGSINVPVLLVVGGFEYHDAVVLSLCTLLGNLLCQVLINVRKDHPQETGRSLIYWEIVAILLPAQLGGSNIGVILSKYLPSSLLLILASVTLLFACTVTAKKGFKLYHHESEAMAKSDKKTDELFETPLLTDDSDMETIFSFGSWDLEEKTQLLAGKKPARHTPKSKPYYHFPTLLIIVMFTVWIFYAILYIYLRKIDMCTWQYVSAAMAMYPILLADILWSIHHCQDRQAQAKHHSTSSSEPTTVLEGDLDFASMSCVPLMLAFCVGMLCSLLGIGGGELLGPLMLSLKVIPQVSSATTSMMSLMNTSLSMTYYMTLGGGDIPVRFGLLVFAIGAVGGTTGRGASLHLTKALGRPSLLVFCLSILLIISFAMNVSELFETDMNFTFTSPC